MKQMLSWIAMLLPVLFLGLLLGGCSGLRPLTRSPEAAPLQDIEQPIRRLAFIGEATIDNALDVEGTTVGGLSALTRDPETGTFYTLPDDPSHFDPTRIYSLEIDLADGVLEQGDVTVESVITLRDANGDTLPTYAIDGEGLVRTATETFILSSEGNVERGVQPSIHEVAGDGSLLRELPLPRRYRSRHQATRGVRHNLAFEALTLSPEGGWLYAGIENALIQEGPEADLDQPSPARIIRYDLRGNQPVEEYLYWVESLPATPPTPDAFRVNGLVELLALEGQQLLALERAFVAGVGNSVRLFLVDLQGATDVHRIDLARARKEIRPVRKRLLLDLAELGVELDNLEGLAHGPDLPDGRHTLLLISDDNFSPRQKTQILAFAWSHLPVTLSDVQTQTHESPLQEEWLYGIGGIVTAISPAREEVHVWIQSVTGDQNTSTSDALLLCFPEDPKFLPGDEILATGRVSERGRTGNLTVTALRATSASIVSRGNALPEARALGQNVPFQIDDDSLAVFEPHDDAIDFYESLEGMRVEIPGATVVGAASRYGDLVVLPSSRSSDEERSRVGGVLLTPENVNSRRIQIDPRLLDPDQRERLTALPVGSSIPGSLVGVLDYSFGVYEVVLTEPVGEVIPASHEPDRSSLTSAASLLTIATFNVENLDALDSPDKFSRVASTIVTGLGAPDILGLQEVQDENGAEDNGVVSAAGTLERLVEEIIARGGPRYEWYQIDPANNTDGGQPGANIRVVFLVHPTRLGVPGRGPGARNETAVVTLEGRPRLASNPVRVTPDAAAFAFDEALGFEASRKALALEVEFGGRPVFVVNAHLKSKRGDDGLFGSAQPPQRHSERQRSEQARVIREFVEQILEVDPLAAVVVLGDLNDHEFRAPIRELTSGALVNLIEHVPLADRYTYNYRGNSQVLDHILVNGEIAETASPEVDIVHLNADFPAAARASDHDPVVVRLALGTD